MLATGSLHVVVSIIVSMMTYFREICCGSDEEVSNVFTAVLHIIFNIVLGSLHIAISRFYPDYYYLIIIGTMLLLMAAYNVYQIIAICIDSFSTEYSLSPEEVFKFISHFIGFCYNAAMGIW